jgi:glycosyltransferase involved in cell wall biosynthesis
LPKQPLISVIVSVFNGERFLDQTLQSLFAQDYRNFEAVVVIDGSHDGSAAILQKYADPRLRVIWKENGGAATAAVAGIAASTGELIAFLDQDDLWMPEKLRLHAEVMEHNPGVALTFSWFQVIDEQSREIGIHSAQVTGTVSFRDLVIDFVIGGTSNVVVRREAVIAVGGPDPSIPNMYDFDLCLKIALLAPGNIRAIPHELMRYRRHPAQVTRKIGALESEWGQALEKLRTLAPEEVAAVERRANSNMQRYFARLRYESGEYVEGLRHLRRGWALAPVSFPVDPRNWLTIAACLSGTILPSALLRAVERIAGIRRG